MNYWKAIGTRISDVLYEKRMTQGDLAKKINRSPSTVSSYIVGRQAMTTKMVVQIAEALGVTPEYLMTGKIESANENSENCENDSAITVVELKWKALIHSLETQVHDLSERLEKANAIIEKQEKPTITAREEEFLACLDCDCFFARDEDGTLGIYHCYIEQSVLGNWIPLQHDMCDNGVWLDNSLFPFITWESGKAWNIEKLRELEVKE